MRIRLFLLACFLTVGAAAAAEPPADTRPPIDLSLYVHQVWQRSQGLPQDTVAAVIQARDGYLWMATQEGLVRFDGARFTLFNKGNTPAFTHNDVGDVVEGPDGSLWIGTFGGLLQWKNGTITAHPTRETRRRDEITRLAIDRDGAIWAGTQNGGLNRFKDGRFEFFGVENGLPNLRIDDLTVDGSGALWVATPSGLGVRRGAQWTTYDATRGLPTTAVRQVLEARDGTVWVGTDKGLARIRDGVVSIPPQPAALAGAAVWSLFEDRGGTIWAGTDAGAIWRYAGASSSSLTLDREGPGNTIQSIAEDREGSIWIGTYATGLHRLWRGLFTHFAKEEGLAGDQLRTILQSRGGTMWFSTDGTGVSRLDGGTVTNFTTKDGLAHDSARSLFEDSRGTTWVGTRGGLSRFENGRFRTLATTVGLNVRALAEDPTGTLWIGSSNRGVFRLVNGTLVDVAEDNRTKLPTGIVRSIFQDHDGAMWVGTGTALTRWHNGSATVLTVRDGMPPDPVYCIHQDSRHTYWLGTYGGGLVRLKNGKITRYRQADGLFDDVVYQILEDDRDNLWINCNNGVFRVSKSQLDQFADGQITRISSVAYDSSDGMISSECNGNAQPAGWKAADGRLWFPTTKGAVIVDPTDIRRSDLAPLVAIERIVANKQSYSPWQAGVVGPGPGQIEFTFTGLGFIAPRKMRFQYKLDGLESDWVDAGDRRQTGYGNLAPGTYVFRVKASSIDGVWSDPGAEYTFVLQPRAYQTAWFRGLLLLAVVGIVFASHRIRMWRHVARERELTDRVEQALGRIKVLNGLIPICASCKNIRDDHGYWSQLELYLKTHSEATFSHGICPDCMQKLYGEYTEPPT